MENTKQVQDIKYYSKLLHHIRPSPRHDQQAEAKFDAVKRRDACLALESWQIAFAMLLQYKDPMFFDSDDAANYLDVTAVSRVAVNGFTSFPPGSDSDSVKNDISNLLEDLREARNSIAHANVKNIQGKAESYFGSMTKVLQKIERNLGPSGRIMDDIPQALEEVSKCRREAFSEPRQSPRIRASLIVGAAAVTGAAAAAAYGAYQYHHINAMSKEASSWHQESALPRPFRRDLEDDAVTYHRQEYRKHRRGGRQDANKVISMRVRALI